MSSTGSLWPTRLVFASGVFLVGCLGEILRDVLASLSQPTSLGIVVGHLLSEIVPTTVLTLGTVVVVFGIYRRFPIQSISVELIALVALVAGLLGRYIGIVLTTRGIPTPIVLATAGDIALGVANLRLTLVVLTGVLAAGQFSVVGALGGIGLASLMTDTE